jgi:phage shock protein PspC (stress-responsive transcriptional regulator)
MQRVITINLNGNAYQLDESGYDALRDYLAGAERALAANPDRIEIMADLQQAIADKCQKFLGPHKSVVNADEVAQIVKEMGPIDAAADEDGADAAGGSKAAGGSAPPPKRLRRIPDGAMIAGVCNGLAVYFGIDVAFIRIGFVLVALLTKGVGIMAYVVTMFIIPEANTPEERAAAGGPPFNAKEVIDGAKRQYAEGARHWRRNWRQQQRQWRRYGWPPAGLPGAAPPLWAGALLPVFALVHLALFLAMATMMISLVNTGEILSRRLPPDVPLWAGVLILLVGYQIVVSPIRAVQQWSWHPRAAAQHPAHMFWNAVVWLIGLTFVVWLASEHIPEIREFVQRLPEIFRQFIDAIRGLGER